MPGDQGLEAGVEVMEPPGAETICGLSVSGAPLTARIRGEAVPAAGSNLGLHVDPASVNSFDKASGRRVLG